ncbi:3-phosphoshikimate 1-carboxyvinyltransferase [Thermostilla marina]
MGLPEVITIPVSGPVKGKVVPPGSKSITNRALVCAALADGRSTLTGALDSEDTQVMIEALRRLGIAVIHSPDQQQIEVEGCAGRIPASEGDLFLANSGTSIRFLTALCTLGRGTYRLDGIQRMRERPIGDLVKALRVLGADVTTEFGNDCPPVIVRADGLPGGRADVDGSISSQFLSGLLMAAPYAQAPVVLEVRGTLVSVPYVRMTIEVMQAFGASVHVEDDRIFRVDKGVYRGCEYAVEPDASAASYFFAAAAVTGGEIEVHGLTENALQGDVRFCDCLREMGCGVRYKSDAVRVTGGRLVGRELDMNAISDTVPTLAVVALFAEGPTTIRNVAHIRCKETDRISAVATEIRKLGAEVEEFDDGLRIHPRPVSEYRAAEIATYNDHRMAMSFAVAGLRIPGVAILDPGCTRKTYPGFFDDFFRLIRASEM